MRNKLAVQILNETPLEVKEEVQLNAKQLLENYYATATPEQVVKEFEDLGVEFVELPITKVTQNKITFYNLLRSNGTTKVTMDRAEAALYYIELHKFLTDELNTTTTTNS